MSRITLLQNDEIIESKGFEEFPKVFFVGRDAECLLRVPNLERAVSRKHARIKKTWNKKIIVFDFNSRTGIYFRGKRVKSQKLRPGEKVIFHNFGILLDKDASQSLVKTKPQLILKEGSIKRKRFVLEPGLIQIGKSPEVNNIVLPGTYVSNHHATIRVQENGKAEIWDENSTNGTFVKRPTSERKRDSKISRGERVQSSQNRAMLLADLSEIEIGEHVLTFRAGQDISGIRKGRVIFFFSLIVFFAFFGLSFLKTYLSPSADELIEISRQYADEGRYEEALEALNKAKGSRSVRGREQEIDSTIDLYEKWLDSLNRYYSAQEKILDKDWDSAGQLLAGIPESEWGPFPQGLGPKAVTLGKILTDAVNLSKQFKDEKNNLGKLKNIREQLKGILSDLKGILSNLNGLSADKQNVDWLPFKEIEKIEDSSPFKEIEKIEDVINQWDTLNELLGYFEKNASEKLTLVNLNLSFEEFKQCSLNPLLDFIKRSQKTGSEYKDFNNLCDKLKKPLDILNTSFDSYKLAFDSAIDWKECDKEKLKSNIEEIVKGLDKGLMLLKDSEAELKDSEADAVRKTGEILRVNIHKLENSFMVVSNKLHEVETILNSPSFEKIQSFYNKTNFFSNVSNVLNCDTINKNPYPEIGERERFKMFDEMVGRKEMWEFLNQFQSEDKVGNPITYKKAFENSNFLDDRNLTILYQALDFIEKGTLFLNLFSESPQGEYNWTLQSEHVKKQKKIIEERVDEIQTPWFELYTEANDDSPLRSKIIAAGISFAFLQADNTLQNKKFKDELQEFIKEKVPELNNCIKGLYETYTSQMYPEEERINARNKLKNNAIPGMGCLDSILKNENKNSF